MEGLQGVRDRGQKAKTWGERGGNGRGRGRGPGGQRGPTGSQGVLGGSTDPAVLLPVNAGLRNTD